MRTVTTSGALSPGVDVFDRNGDARCGNVSNETDCTPALDSLRLDRPAVSIPLLG